MVIIIALLAHLFNSIGFGLGELIFRVVGIYFVGRYVSELEEENNINSSSSQLYYFDDIDDNFPPR